MKISELYKERLIKGFSSVGTNKLVFQIIPNG